MQAHHSGPLERRLRRGEGAGGACAFGADLADGAGRSGASGGGELLELDEELDDLRGVSGPGSSSNSQP